MTPYKIHMNKYRQIITRIPSFTSTLRDSALMRKCSRPVIYRTKKLLEFMVPLKLVKTLPSSFEKYGQPTQLRDEGRPLPYVLKRS